MVKISKIKCRHCGYEWLYRGIGKYTKCSRCNRNNRIEKVTLKVYELDD